MKGIKNILGKAVSAVSSYGCLIVVERPLPYEPSSRIRSSLNHASQKYSFRQLNISEKASFEKYLKFDSRGITKGDVLWALRHNEICFFAEKDNGIVSSLCIALNSFPFPKLSPMKALFHGKAYIKDIFVAPSFRGSGVAVLMLSEGLKIISEMGFEKTATIINQNNKTSLGFFAKMGFTPSHKLYYVRIGPFRKHFLRSF